MCCCLLCQRTTDMIHRVCVVPAVQVELARKLALSGLIGLFQRGSVLQTVCACFISFFFFAISFRERPFEEDRLNAVKIFTEFQIFGILLVCIVIQTRQVDFDAEVAQLADYGTAQVALTLSVMPISIWAVVTGVADVVEELDEDSDGDEEGKGDVDDNPLHEDNPATTFDAELQRE